MVEVTSVHRWWARTPICAIGIYTDSFLYESNLCSHNVIFNCLCSCHPKSIFMGKYFIDQIPKRRMANCWGTHQGVYITNCSYFTVSLYTSSILCLCDLRAERGGGIFKSCSSVQKLYIWRLMGVGDVWRWIWRHVGQTKSAGAVGGTRRVSSEDPHQRQRKFISWWSSLILHSLDVTCDKSLLTPEFFKWQINFHLKFVFSCTNFLAK